MLDIQTFDARRGGNALYKALAHPLAAERLAELAAELRAAGPLALFDPEGNAAALYALHPGLPAPSSLFVQDVGHLDRHLGDVRAQPVTELARTQCRTLLVTAFDTGRLEARLAGLAPHGMNIVSLDRARIPGALLTVPRTYLDRLNFATNFAFFRDAGGLSTRLVSANYWAGYGAGQVRLWLRLFDASGAAIATWEQTLGETAGGFSIDSSAVRARFGLPEFTGQLFIHAIGVAGHDVVKYALDVFGRDANRSLSVTHDANAWPSDRYAGLPAPNPGEQVVLWIQNSHAAPIPSGAITLDRMGAETPVALEETIPPYASRAVDVAALLPGLHWPAQIELRAGRHLVRPRYEVIAGGRTRIAHVNVERADLRPDPGIRTLSNLLGRGYILPFPILPPERYRTIVQPNPMAETQASLPIRLDVFAASGHLLGQRFLGNLARSHDFAGDLDDFGPDAAHAELTYDFRAGGEADGWLHGLFRYESRLDGHAAETSFGAHIFNTAMTYKDEPQSYSGPPPGLSTRLFLKLGDARHRSFAYLIYPASAAWHPLSTTRLELVDGQGRVVDTHDLRIACSGSALVRPAELFDVPAAGPDAYVLVRDATCRLFGFHGLEDGAGGFSLDHMFGF
jgi:hypothetical protein